MSNYDVDAATARNAFVANLISLVEDDESGVTSQDALRLINTTFTGNDGVERTLLSWNEFDGIEGKLIDAHKKSKDNEEEIVNLNYPNQGIYLPKMTERKIYNFSTNAVALVLESKF